MNEPTTRPLPDLRGLIAILEACPALADALRRMADPRETITIAELMGHASTQMTEPTCPRWARRSATCSRRPSGS